VPGGPLAANQGIAVGIENRIYRHINIEIRPVKMMWLGALDVKNAGHRCLTKPRKFLEGQEYFPISQEEPNAMGRNTGHFNQ